LTIEIKNRIYHVAMTIDKANQNRIHNPDVNFENVAIKYMYFTVPNFIMTMHLKIEFTNAAVNFENATIKYFTVPN